MNRIALLALLILPFTGCSSLKDATGDYIIEAVTGNVTAAVDAKLNERGLSLDEIKKVADLDGSGAVSQEELLKSTRLAVEDMVIAKMGPLGAGLRDEIKAATEDMVTADSMGDLKEKGQTNLWALVLAVIGYLTKQVFSAKSDGKRDKEIAESKTRLAMMEKLLQKDIDGDGTIGEGAA